MIILTNPDKGIQNAILNYGLRDRECSVCYCYEKIKYLDYSKVYLNVSAVPIYEKFKRIQEDMTWEVTSKHNGFKAFTEKRQS